MSSPPPYLMPYDSIVNGDDDCHDGDGDVDDEYTNLCLVSLLSALSIHILLTFHLLLLLSLSHYSLSSSSHMVDHGRRQHLLLRAF